MADTVYATVTIDGAAVKWEGIHHSDMQGLAPDGSFPLSEFNWEIGRPVSSGSRLAGSAEAEAITLEMTWDKSGPVFVDALHRGKVLNIDIVSITADPNTAGYEITQEFVFEDARVTNFATHAEGSAGISMSVTIAYNKFTIADPKGGTESTMSHANAV